MWALVEDNNITRIFRRPQGFTLNDTQYAPDIFAKWSASDLEDLGLYPVQSDETNLKNETY